MKQNSNSYFYRLSFPEKILFPKFENLLQNPPLCSRTFKKERLLKGQIHCLVRLVNIVFDHV